MKFNTQLKALAAATALGLSGHAMADGTAAGFSVDNTVTLDYAVSGTQQASENATVSFLVDHKINFTIEDNGIEIVSSGTQPGATVQYTFRVINTGNGYVDFDLSLVDTALDTALSSLTGTPDDDVTFETISLFWDEDKDGTDNSGAENKTFIDALAFEDLGGGENVALVVATVKLYALNQTNAGFYNDSDTSDGIHTVDGLVGGLSLTAQAAANENTGVPTATPSGTLGTVYASDDSGTIDSASVDLVFADAGNDNSETYIGGVEVSTSQLNVVKSVQVLNDPINGTTNPKAIPGAQIEYTITVTNVGGTATDNDGVTGISYTITDDLESNAAIDKTQPIVITTDGGADTQTVDSDTDTIEGDIELTFDTPLAAGASNEIKFTAFIE